jgi:hypothetical protein
LSRRFALGRRWPWLRFSGDFGNELFGLELGEVLLIDEHLDNGLGRNAELRLRNLAAQLSDHLRIEHAQLFRSIKHLIGRHGHIKPPCW